MLLIFDCDGVVVDSMTIHNEVEASVYRRFGIDIAPPVLAQKYAGIPLPETFKLLYQETGILIPAETENEIEHSKLDVFTQKLKPVAGIHEALFELKNVPRCIASGSIPKTLEHMLRLTELYDHFVPHIYSSKMVKRGKPHPDLFLYVAEKMGHRPDDCLVIEDGVPGIQAARAAGMHALGFTGASHTDPEHANRLRAAGAAAIFDDMRDLPKYVTS